jgi:DNA-directed RNA polymerase specialized sigma24 family protein
VDSEPSVERWLKGVVEGDAAATEELWNYCFPQLVRFARYKLGGIPRRAADEEDVALDAMDSFCRALREGRFLHLADQNGLRRLLLQMTARKATDLVRREMSTRRGKASVRGDSALRGRSAATATYPGRPADLLPELAVVATDEVERLLGLLEDPQLQAMAVAKMEGRENREIADRLHCSMRTVERRLHLIRTVWEHELVRAASR